MSLNQEEEEYIERLYREMYTRLCIYAMSALGSKALAEEVVQDTFRIACIKPDGLMSSKNPRGWLVNTLKNVIRNRRRTEARLSNALLAAMSAYEPQASTTVETTEFIVAYSDALGEEDFQLLVNIVVRRYTMRAVRRTHLRGRVFERGAGRRICVLSEVPFSCGSSSKSKSEHPSLEAKR